MNDYKDKIPTTLNKIRSHSPCQDGWENLLKFLGKSKADDEPLLFSTILESNGLGDAVWCLRSICPEHDKEVRLFTCDVAEHVLHLYEDKYPEDKRPRKAIEESRAYANDEITEEELASARAAAWDAALDASRASARASARAAAWDAALDAAYNTSCSARYAWRAAYNTEQEFLVKLLIERFG